MKTVMILSGGMDSTTLLYSLLNDGHEVKALAFDYGQKHKREIMSAKVIAEKVGIELRVIDISSVRELLGGSSQTDESVPVPHGHYAEENMKKTVVPNRNMIMLSIAAGWAISLKFDGIVFGAHAGDHDIYPDCRTEFVKALGDTFALCDWSKVKLLAPFQDKTKGDIAVIGKELGVPFELTWTCYEGGNKPCGKCGACTERKEAMAFAGIEE